MLCPYCLRQTILPTCDNGKEALHLLYSNRSENSAILSAVEFRGHDKTVYLARLPHVMSP